MRKRLNEKLDIKLNEICFLYLANDVYAYLEILCLNYFVPKYIFWV